MTLFSLLDRSKSAAANRAGRAAHYGCCHRCRDSWAWKEPHTTPITYSKGCFPLCEECWSVLTPEERLPFYAEMVADHCCGSYKALGFRSTGDVPNERIVEYLEEWPQIRDAVLEGK